MEAQDTHPTLLSTDDATLRRAVGIVALLNLAYFGIEFGVALTIGSVSLFADSIDFLEDAAVNGLILVVASVPLQRVSRETTFFHRQSRRSG